MRKYNWGILAPGGIAHKFASDLKILKQANLYAVGSRSKERAEAFARKYGFTKAYGSYEELAADPDVDIIYVATPHISHYENTMLCLDHGKAVLCEKPVAMNAGQLKMMMVKAKKQNKFFMEALWTRFIPSFLKFREIVQSGILGEIYLIESDFSFKAPYNTEGRLFNKDLGGGSLLDIGIYPVFMALEMAGVPGQIDAQLRTGETGVDEICTMLFTHENGIKSVLFSSIIQQGRTETLIHGEHGFIRLNTMWHIPTTIDLFLNGKKKKHFKFREPGYGYQYEAQHAMECMDRGLIESDAFSWEKSVNLISTLDQVRKITGIRYKDTIEAV